MIFVKRNPALIPEWLLKAAEVAQKELESKATPEERKAYIESKGRLWRRFGRYLKQMSYGKCWYSESDCIQSRTDVDHFRPKKEARRSETESDDGYPWLAFSWENFRYAAQLSNQLSTDENTGEVVGKGAWFPLMPGSPRATWDNRAASERPLLLDPVSKHDVRLITIDASGKMRPSDLCLGDYERARVTESIKYLGLNLDGLTGARQRAMEAVQEIVQDVLRTKAAADGAGANAQQIAEALPIDTSIERIQAKTHPREPYAAAIRAQLKAMGFGEYCLRVEEMEIG